MGEADPRSRKLIKQVTGFEPEWVTTEDGMLLLRIGDFEMAAWPGLWSDPHAWQHEDGLLRVTWAGQNVFIPVAKGQARDG